LSGVPYNILVSKNLRGGGSWSAW